MCFGRSECEERGAEMKNSLASFFLFFSLIPYLRIIPIQTDTQPNALICGFLYLICYNKSVRLKELNELLIIVLVATILLLFSGFSFNALRSYSNYLSLYILTYAAYIIFRYMKGLDFGVYASVVCIWFVVGSIQMFIDPSFLSFLIPRGNSEITLSTGRGIVCLAPEATHYGLICLLLFVLGYINWKFDKKIRLIYVLILIQIFFYSRSSLTILIIAITSLVLTVYRVLTDKKRRIKFLIGFALFSLMVFYSIYTNYQEIQNYRVGKLLTTLIDNPLLFVVLDNSANERFVHIFFPIIGFFDNYFLPHGFDNFAQYYKECLRKFPNLVVDWTYNNNSSARIMSGWGAAFYEIGIFTFLIIDVFRRIINAVCKGMEKVFIFLVLMLVFFNAFPFSTPIVSLILGDLLYIRKWKSINRLKNFA